MNRRSFLSFLPAVPVGIGAVVSGGIASAEESTVSVRVGDHVAAITTRDLVAGDIEARHLDYDGNMIIYGTVVVDGDKTVTRKLKAYGE